MSARLQVGDRALLFGCTATAPKQLSCPKRSDVPLSLATDWRTEKARSGFGWFLAELEKRESRKTRNMTTRLAKKSTP